MRHCSPGQRRELLHPPHVDVYSRVSAEEEYQLANDGVPKRMLDAFCGVARRDMTAVARAGFGPGGPMVAYGSAGSAAWVWCVDGYDIEIVRGMVRWMFNTIRFVHRGPGERG